MFGHRVTFQSPGSCISIPVFRVLEVTVFRDTLAYVFSDFRVFWHTLDDVALPAKSAAPCSDTLVAFRSPGSCISIPVLRVLGDSVQ